MAREIITAGTKLYMNEEELSGMLSTPDLSEGEPEKIEVTTLADSSKRYINGLRDLGDGLEFEFNYESDGDSAFKGLKVHSVKPQNSNIYRYLCGKYDSSAKAKSALPEVRKKFNEAFVVEVSGTEVTRVK